MTAQPDPYYQAEFYSDVPMKRGLAWIVDTILIALLTLVIMPFTAFTALFFLPVLYMTLSFMYRTISLARKSATPGMRLFGIELRSRDGERFDLGLALAHTLGYTLSVSTVLVQLFSIILMLTSARGQSLTDHVLGTVAINRPARW